MKNLPPIRRRVNQGLLFHRLRWHLLRNTVNSMKGQSLVRPVTILMCSLVVGVFVFGISLAGFFFLEEQRLPLTGGIVGIIFDLMFLTLGVMLVFSTGLILYSSLFASRETEFLFSKPLADDQVFAYHFQSAVGFSSWAFLLLGGPILLAFGLVCQGPWFFYLLLPFFFLGFVLLPGSLGALVCLLVVNFFPQRRKQFLLGGIALVAILAGIWMYSVSQASRPDNWGREAVNRLLGRFSFARGALLPSHWVARGLRAAGRGQTDESLYFLALVWSNGLFVYLLASWASGRLYRSGYNRMASSGDQPPLLGSLNPLSLFTPRPVVPAEKATVGAVARRSGGGDAWVDRLLAVVLFPIRPQTRLLIIKDFRTFRRDPQQWAQVLIFSGLLILYFANIRRLFVSDISRAYQNTVSLLNLCATSLLLCTYTGRFVYPMLSLEGRKFWILGLLPVEREQLLWGKFTFSTGLALAISVPLVLTSDVMLGIPGVVVALHALIVVVLTAGLSGLSVGLGACMPNFRETDPSKIAVGFGGTLNLVAGLFFLLAIIALMAAPWHIQMAVSQTGSLSTIGLWMVGVGVAAGLVIGGAVVVVPLQFGIRALRRMEF